MNKTFFLTTTLPYVNAPLHMGHALEFIRADTIARYKKLLGYDVYFNTGTDEHGLKIFEKAKEKRIARKREKVGNLIRVLAINLLTLCANNWNISKFAEITDMSEDEIKQKGFVDKMKTLGDLLLNLIFKIR
jgi:methionyl-tRNA synthetase